MSESIAAEPRTSPAAPASTTALVGTSGLILFVLLALLWGANWPMMKRVIAEIPIWTFRAACIYIGAAGLMTMAWLGRQKLAIPRGRLGPLALVGLLNIAGWNICLAAGLVHLTAGRAAIIGFTMPLWATLMAVAVLGERLTWNIVAGLAVGLAGMAALLLPAWRGLLVDPLGPLFMILAAISWAAGTVGLKFYRLPMPVIVLTAWQLLLGGVPLAVGAVLFERDFSPASVSGEAWLAFAYTAIVAMWFCHWAWFKLVSAYPAVITAICSLAIPVVGVLSSAVMLGEPVGGAEIAALLLVVSALFLVLVLPALRRGRMPPIGGPST